MRCAPHVYKYSSIRPPWSFLVTASKSSEFNWHQRNKSPFASSSQNRETLRVCLIQRKGPPILTFLASASNSLPNQGEKKGKMARDFPFWRKGWPSDQPDYQTGSLVGFLSDWKNSEHLHVFLRKDRFEVRDKRNDEKPANKNQVLFIVRRNYRSSKFGRT